MDQSRILIQSATRQTKPEGDPTSHAATRLRLIQAAKTLFAEKGYDGTTVKELAEHAGVNISLVSYHFGGKEGLFRSCLEQIGVTRLAAMQSILKPPASADEVRVRLQLFFEDFFRLNLAEPEVTRILHRECETGFPLVFDIFKETFFKSFETLVEFIQSGQSLGMMNPKLDPRICALSMLAGASDLVRKDPLNEKLYQKTIKDPVYQAQVISNLLSLYLNGLQPNSEKT